MGSCQAADELRGAQRSHLPGGERSDISRFHGHNLGGAQTKLDLGRAHRCKLGSGERSNLSGIEPLGYLACGQCRHLCTTERSEVAGLEHGHLGSGEALPDLSRGQR